MYFFQWSGCHQPNSPRYKMVTKLGVQLLEGEKSSDDVQLLLALSHYFIVFDSSHVSKSTAALPAQGPQWSSQKQEYCTFTFLQTQTFFPRNQVVQQPLTHPGLHVLLYRHQSSSSHRYILALIWGQHKWESHFNYMVSVI